MGRSPCCSKEGLNRGAWTALEDKILKDYIKVHGEGRWRDLPRKAGLKRCGKSCRLRWLNYLRPDIKRGNISHDEEELIIRLHKLLGNRWSLIAGRLPGRTDNEIKNYWNTILSKKVHDQQYWSASAWKHPSQPNKKVKQNPRLASPTKPNIKPQPPPETQGVQTKPAMCSSALIDNDQDHNSNQTQNLERPHLTNKQLEQQGPCDLLVPLDSEDDNNYNNSSDFVHHVDMADLWLSDLLNSDSILDFNYSNVNDDDNDNEFWDGPSVFSEGMFEDWTVKHCLQQNVASHHHGFASFLEPGSVGDWPAK
ncbi:hypothetical protein NMG60_11013545 [Bertholletia excelsa]